MTIETPYTVGQKHHETLFGDLAMRARQWRLVALGLLILLAIVATDNVLGRFSTRYYVHVMEVLPDGSKVRVLPIDRTYRPKEEYVRGTVRTFVRQLRERIKDPVVTRERWADLRAHVTPTGKMRLQQEYAEHNPMTYKGTLQVSVSSVLPVSGKTYQVRWQEARFTDQNVPIDTQRFIGTFTVVLQPPTTQPEVEANPLGILMDTWTISPEG
jgi:type IV secretion system protein VirB5